MVLKASSPPGAHPLADLADAARAQLPERLEHVELARTRVDLRQVPPPRAAARRLIA
jgi:hypothetical protein